MTQMLYLIVLNLKESGNCKTEQENSGNGYLDVANELDAKQGEMNDEQIEIKSNKAPFQFEVRNTTNSWTKQQSMIIFAIIFSNNSD